MARSYKEAMAFVEEAEKQLKADGAHKINWSSPCDDNKLPKDKGVYQWLYYFFYLSYMYGGDYGKNAFSSTDRIEGNRSSGKDKSYPGRRRSLGDIYKIALTHYDENVKLLDIMDALYTLANSSTVLENPYDVDRRKYRYIVYCTICSTVYRRVFNVAGIGTHQNYSLQYISSENNAGSDEANITKEDYATLFNPAVKKQKEREEAILAEQEKQRKLDEEKRLQAEALKSKKVNIDELVNQKIRQLMSTSDSDTRRGLVKAVRKVKKSVK